MEFITYTSCPCCGSSQITYSLTANDFTVSSEAFDIWQCRSCSLRFTQQVPAQSLISKYYQAENYISHTDTKTGLVNSLYHRVRKITLNRKAQLIKKYTGIQTGNLLDIGAGTGAFCKHMKDAGWKSTGLEPDEATRHRASALHGIALEPGEALSGLSAQSFDAVTMWHVLEHVHALHEYIAQIKTVLKPGGRAFIAVPNYTSYDAGVYKQFWAAYDVPRHLYHFSPVSVNFLLKKHQLMLLAVQPMWYDSFYVSMLSEQYKNHSAGYVNAFFVGLMSNFKALMNKRRCSSVIYIIGKESSQHDAVQL